MSEDDCGCGGWRIKNDIEDRVRVSTRRDPEGSFTTSLKPVSAPTHTGYVTIARRFTREDAEAIHAIVVRAVTTAIRMTPR